MVTGAIPIQDYEGRVGLGQTVIGKRTGPWNRLGIVSITKTSAGYNSQRKVGRGGTVSLARTHPAVQD